jgi:hypothetical protein
MTKLRADYIRGMLNIFQLRIFYPHMSCMKTRRAKIDVFEIIMFHVALKLSM